MFMPGQVNFADHFVRTFNKTFPACFAFSGIQMDEFCSGMVTVKKQWAHIVIVFAKMHRVIPSGR